jgi:3-hydroxyacyl-[acyl-carrier-protein] dehydratase
MGIVTKKEIEEVLPHRSPFLWMTRVLTCEPGKTIVAELEVEKDLPLFEGHFPTYPVFPGVLVMEALAQAASYCILVEKRSKSASEDADGEDADGQAVPEAQSIGFLAGIDNARFRNQIRPGDTVRLQGRITKNSSRMCVAEVEAWVGDLLCASATQKYVLM